MKPTRVEVTRGLVSPTVAGIKAEIRVEGDFDMVATIIYSGEKQQNVTCKTQFVQKSDGLTLEEVHAQIHMLARCAWMMHRKLEHWPWVDVKDAKLKQIDVSKLDRYAKGYD